MRPFLHEEVAEREGVLVVQQTAKVSDHLTDDTKADAEHVLPGPAAEPKPQLTEEQNGKAAEVHSIAGKVWQIVHRGPFNGATFFESAYFPLCLDQGRIVGRKVEVLGVDYNVGRSTSNESENVGSGHGEDASQMSGVESEEGLEVRLSGEWWKSGLGVYVPTRHWDGAKGWLRLRTRAYTCLCVPRECMVKL